MATVMMILIVTTVTVAGAAAASARCMVKNVAGNAVGVVVVRSSSMFD